MRTLTASFVAALALLWPLRPDAQPVEHLVLVSDHAFSPAVLTIGVGDSVRWTNQSSLPHNARADDGSFRCSTACSEPASSGSGVGAPSAAAWSVARTFDSVGEFLYFCEVHGGPGGIGMAGSIRVQAPEPPETFAINFGLTGPWYDPGTSGQGFYVDVVPSFDPPLIAFAWFTYDSEAGGVERQRWFTGIGAYQPGSDRVELSVLRSLGGAFNRSPPAPQTSPVGTALLVFENCSSARFGFDIDVRESGDDDPERLQGEIALVRTTPDVMCEQLADPGD